MIRDVARLDEYWRDPAAALYDPATTGELDIHPAVRRRLDNAILRRAAIPGSLLNTPAWTSR
jgi:hypothetical protein